MFTINDAGDQVMQGSTVIAYRSKGHWYAPTGLDPETFRAVSGAIWRSDNDVTAQDLAQAIERDVAGGMPTVTADG